MQRSLKHLWFRFTCSDATPDIVVRILWSLIRRSSGYKILLPSECTAQHCSVALPQATVYQLLLCGTWMSERRGAIKTLFFWYLDFYALQVGRSYQWFYYILDKRFGPFVSQYNLIKFWESSNIIFIYKLNCFGVQSFYYTVITLSTTHSSN